MGSQPNQDVMASLARQIGVMKPGKVKQGDTKAEKRLDLMMESDEYALEDKIDGCHYKMVGYRFFSTDNVEKTNNFPHLRDFFEKLGMYNLVLDGEIHYPGKTSQYATHVTGPSPANAKIFQEQNGYIHFTIFDLLRTPKSRWTIRNTYKERRKLLEYFYNTFVKDTPMSEFIHLVPMVVHNKKQYVEQLLASGAEGGVLKRFDSVYVMGKKPMWQWMKIKQSDDEDLVIMGFTPATVLYKGKDAANWPYWAEVNGEQVPVSKGHYNGWIGSVVLGAYVDGVLTKICTASGMSDEVCAHMTENQDLYVGKVARIEFMEKTDDGYPRHPVYKNLHETKTAEECTWEFDRSL